jgi:hypothetical protein
MKINARTRLFLRLNNLIFILLLLMLGSLLAWLSEQYPYYSDWTHSAKHTLNQHSNEIITKLIHPLHINIYVEQDDVSRKAITQLMHKLERVKDNFTYKLINPYFVPDKAQSLNIKETPDGRLLTVLEVHYQNRIEHYQQLAEFLTETELTLLLQRVARTTKHKLVFLQGHGERKPDSMANHDLGLWGRELSQSGFTIESWHLSQQAHIPTDISGLIIASPEVNLLQDEVKLIKNYVQNGGNLLWMLEPQQTLYGLEPLANWLNLTVLDGVLVDPNSWVGANNPGMLVLSTNNYVHPLLSDFIADTLFPTAAGLLLQAPSPDWEVAAILQTASEVWATKHNLDGEVIFNPEQDLDGPFNMAVSLNRIMTDEQDEQHEQRILIIGDGDFISNTFIGNGGNLDLSLRMINWLVAEDEFINLPTAQTEHKLQLSSEMFILLALWFIIILPLTLLLSGFLIWIKRRSA